MDELKSIPCNSCDGYGNLPMPHEGICGVCKGTGEILAKYPIYVSLGGSALKLNGDRYYRVAGAWETDYKVVNGFLLSEIPAHKHIHNVELVAISKEQWEEGNRGYI